MPSDSDSDSELGINGHYPSCSSDVIIVVVTQLTRDILSVYECNTMIYVAQQHLDKGKTRINPNPLMFHPASCALIA